MAKEGIDSFLLDCQRDDKIRLIEAEFGIKGFAVVVKLWQRIYGDHGYYCEWNDDVGLLFSDEIKEGYGLVSEIVSASIRRDIFSKELYEKYRVLTSHGIQKRYFDVVKRRTEVEAKKEYLLLSADKLGENVNIISKNVCRNSKNVCRKSASKEKESKGKESKEDIIAQNPSEIPYKQVVDYLNQKTGSSYKSTTVSTQRHIKARLNDGFALEDFLLVIDVMYKEWGGDDKMKKYLRPETLFGTKFESYLNRAPREKSGPETEVQKDNITTEDEVGDDW